MLAAHLGLLSLEIRSEDLGAYCMNRETVAKEGGKGTLCRVTLELLTTLRSKILTGRRVPEALTIRGDLVVFPSSEQGVIVLPPCCRRCSGGLAPRKGTWDTTSGELTMEIGEGEGGSGHRTGPWQ